MSYTSICVGETPQSINLGTIQRQQPNLKVGRSAANFRMVDGRKWSECSCVSSTNLIYLYTSLSFLKDTPQSINISSILTALPLEPVAMILYRINIYLLLLGHLTTALFLFGLLSVIHFIYCFKIVSIAYHIKFRLL